MNYFQETYHYIYLKSFIIDIFTMTRSPNTMTDKKSERISFFIRWSTMVTCISHAMVANNHLKEKYNDINLF